MREAQLGVCVVLYLIYPDFARLIDFSELIICNSSLNNSINKSTLLSEWTRYKSVLR